LWGSGQLNVKAVQSPDERNAFIELLENVYRFTIGIAAGGNNTFNKVITQETEQLDHIIMEFTVITATGAFAVYPMDLVKTRSVLR